MKRKKPSEPNAASGADDGPNSQKHNIQDDRPSITMTQLPQDDYRESEAVKAIPVTSTTASFFDLGEQNDQDPFPARVSGAQGHNPAETQSITLGAPEHEGSIEDNIIAQGTTSEEQDLSVLFSALQVVG